jgi:hypothetical protein
MDPELDFETHLKKKTRKHWPKGDLGIDARPSGHGV